MWWYILCGRRLMCSQQGTDIRVLMNKMIQNACACQHCLSRHTAASTCWGDRWQAFHQPCFHTKLLCISSPAVRSALKVFSCRPHSSKASRCTSEHYRLFDKCRYTALPASIARRGLIPVRKNKIVFWISYIRYASVTEIIQKSCRGRDEYFWFGLATRSVVFGNTTLAKWTRKDEIHEGNDYQESHEKKKINSVTGDVQ